MTMALPTNHGGNLRKQNLSKQLQSTKGSKGISEKRKANIKKWTTYYRRNWDLYVEQVFQIKLYPIQKILIHLMGVSDEFFAICTRGAAKSFLVALGCLCEATLKPYSEIVLTSSTIPQASKLVEKKIRDEIIKKLSPYLKYMYEHEYIVITKSNTSDGGAYTLTNMLNGSTIKVMPCLDSARGERSTWNVFEEARLLKKTIVDSVFLPMGHVRQAKYYINYPEYHTARWEEKPRTTYITSARLKSEWFWTAYKKTVTKYYTDKNEKYFPFAEDIFAAITDGSRTWVDYRKNKASMSSMDFEMEILNTMLGESESAFFTYNSFKDNQVLERCFKPPTIMQLYMGEDIGNPLKKENEIRLIISDFAFANTTSSEKNDNTQIMLMSLHWKKTRFERHIDYITQHPASDSLGAADRIRELYYDYQADYYVPD